MNIDIFKENVKQSVSIIGSLPNYIEDIISGKLDEVLSCGIFYSLLERSPKEDESIYTSLVINKLNEFKFKIISKKELEKKQLEDKIKKDVFEKFINQNKLSSIGTIKEISIQTGISISALRKLKRDNQLHLVIEEHYPNHICCKKLNYIKSIYLKDKGKEFLKTCKYESKKDENELNDFIDFLFYTGFSRNDYIYLKKYINSYNKYFKDIII